MTRIAVAIYAADPILESGVTHQLRPRPEVEVLRTAEADRAEVSLVVVDGLDEESEQLLRRLQRTSSVRTGLIVGEFGQDALQTAIEWGVAAVLRRRDANRTSWSG